VHLPEQCVAQRKLKVSDMPTPQQKLDIFKSTSLKMNEAEYQFTKKQQITRSSRVI
jgi:oxygen-independent coproporphyrinogen-3 oxidase